MKEHTLPRSRIYEYQQYYLGYMNDVDRPGWSDIEGSSLQGAIQKFIEEQRYELVSTIPISTNGIWLVTVEAAIPFNPYHHTQKFNFRFREKHAS